MFCNPPYSDIKSWAKKCLYEATQGHAKVVVMLVPARTDTKWFHDYVYGKAEIRFIKGRVKFYMNGIRAKQPSPFPSMIVIFKGEEE